MGIHGKYSSHGRNHWLAGGSLLVVWPSMTQPTTVIILAAHGSSHCKAQAALTAFALRAGERHPGVAVHLAYTAVPHASSHLGPPPGRSLADTLAAVRTAGLSPQPAGELAAGAPCSTVAASGAVLDERSATGLNSGPGAGSASRPTRLLVQSLHVIAGDEWERMVRQVTRFARKEGVEARLGGPLLAEAEDAKAVALAVAASLEDAGDAKACCLEQGQPDAPGAILGSGAPGQPVVLMGHGTTHQAQELYRALAQRLEALRPDVLLGVMEAHSPDDPLHIQAIIARLKARGAVTARLMPLLTVSGRHAHNDLAGNGPRSWKTLLAHAGITCQPDLAGLVEREPFAGLWLDKLARIASG